MNDIFEKLNVEYQNAQRCNDTEKQKQSLRQMKDYLIDMLKETIIQINGASYEKTIEFKRTLNALISSLRMTHNADIERSNQMKRSKYSPDNPYNG